MADSVAEKEENEKNNDRNDKQVTKNKTLTASGPPSQQEEGYCCCCQLLALDHSSALPAAVLLVVLVVDLLAALLLVMLILVTTRTTTHSWQQRENSDSFLLGSAHQEQFFDFRASGSLVSKKESMRMFSTDCSLGFVSAGICRCSGLIGTSRILNTYGVLHLFFRKFNSWAILRKRTPRVGRLWMSQKKTSQE